MSKRRYQGVRPRNTVQMLPPSIDDYVGEDNPVRAIDAFVDALDLNALGFGHTETWSGAGQPPFDPALLLKLYLYGYQNGLRSSRTLEAATRRNLEVIWLCQDARPSYKTIADFRKNNLSALQNVQLEFVQVCRELSLLGGRRVAIDGSFMKASANRSSVHVKRKLARDLSRLEARIKAYLEEMDEADVRDTGESDADPELAARMASLVARRDQARALQERLEASGESQLSEVDPDARHLHKGGTSVVGYNGQIAVDDKTGMIVAVDLVQDGNDRNQLEPMMSKAREAMGSEGLIGLADRGYANAEQLKACEEKGMEVYVPLLQYSSRKGSKKLYGKDDFDYDGERDHYVCPAGRKLMPNGSTAMLAGKRHLVYRAGTRVCGVCPLASRCLSPSVSGRQLFRWEGEYVVDRHRARMAKGGDVMRRRGALVEHPFGTLKRWAGLDFFLMRGLAKCRAELNLMVLGYNFRRMLKEVGMAVFMAYCQARREARGMGM